MTTNTRKPKSNTPRAYTVKNIYRNYTSDEEKKSNQAILANGIAQIITAKQQKKSFNAIGKFK